jgi:hypothetical protein
MAINIQRGPWGEASRSIDSLVSMVLDENRYQEGKAESLRRWKDNEADEDRREADAKERYDTTIARENAEITENTRRYNEMRARQKEQDLETDFKQYISFVESRDTTPEQGMMTLKSLLKMPKFEVYFPDITSRITSKEDAVFDANVLADITELTTGGTVDDFNNAMAKAKTIKGANRRTKAFTSIQTFQASQLGIEGSALSLSYKAPELKLIEDDVESRNKEYEIRTKNRVMTSDQYQEEWDKIDKKYNFPEARRKRFLQGMTTTPDNTYPDFVPADANSQAWYNTIQSAIKSGDLPVPGELTKELYDEIREKHNLIRMDDGTYGVEVKGPGTTVLDLFYDKSTRQWYHRGSGKVATVGEVSEFNKAQGAQGAQGEVDLPLLWKGAVRRAVKTSNSKEYLKKNYGWSDDVINEAMRRKGEL